MPFLMLYATDKNALKTVRNWYRRHPEFFVGQLDNKVFLLKNTGEILAYATKLMLKYKGFVDLFVIETISLRDIPENVRRVAEWMETRPRIGLKRALEKLGIHNLKELQKEKLQYYKSSSKKLSKRSRNPDSTGLIYTSQVMEKKNSRN